MDGGQLLVVNAVNAAVELAFDLCLTQSSPSASLGPLLAGQGDNDGIGFGEASDYLPVPTGTWTLKIVSAAATDCSGSGIESTTVTIEKDRQLNVVWRGDYPSGTLTPLQFTNPNNGPAAGQAAYRFVHTYTDTAFVDVGVVDQQSMLSVDFEDVPNGDITTILERSPGAIEVRAQLSGIPSKQSTHALTLAEGASVTIIGVGSLFDESSSLLGCDTNGCTALPAVP